ncbi:hypothetical protein GWK47_053612 [Chionoecetes opilio]|uniref:Uncharacterized protein n=1 Tax=Chionoecetes opilio TaxID=41210 RepID=A0A8J5CR58_CHIOP|nr:hypothetical protein GWK47_053612 [Chionoecetes opilio]
MTSHNHLPPLHSPPPNITLRYTFDPTTPPADISTTFFNITEIPHIRCFYSGKQIIVRPVDTEALTSHTNKTNTRTLVDNGFHLVESVQARIARTIMAFRVCQTLHSHPTQTLIHDINTRNEVTVEDLYLIRSSKFPILKTRCSHPDEAKKILQRCIRVGSIIIPSYNIEPEHYKLIQQCLMCYKFDHSHIPL